MMGSNIEWNMELGVVMSREGCSLRITVAVVHWLKGCACSGHAIWCVPHVNNVSIFVPTCVASIQGFLHSPIPPVTWLLVCGDANIFVPVSLLLGQYIVNRKMWGHARLICETLGRWAVPVLPAYHHLSFAFHLSKTPKDMKFLEAQPDRAIT